MESQMSDEEKTAKEDAETTLFLNTNGPPDGAFRQVIPAHLLEGKSESEKWLYEMVGVSAKQNEWLIRQVSGLKLAHKTIHRKMDEGVEHFKKIDETLDVFTKIRDAWLTRKKMVRNILLGALTLVILPFIGLFGVEVAKHFLHWP